MIENSWMALISKKKRNFKENLIMLFLYLISFFYGFGLFIRNLFYRLNIFKSKKFRVNIISVGNITMGGTGKTPFVEEMGKRYIKDGKDVLVVAKGYKRHKIKNIDIVSDGRRMLIKAINAGDEPYLLARNLEKAKVIVGNNKIKALEYGIENMKPDIVFIDDAFQKRQILKNSFQIVLINAMNPFGFGRLFPAGFLREPVSSLKNADAIVITNANLSNDPARIEKIKEILLGYGKNMKIFESEYMPKYFYNVSTGEKFNVSSVKNRKVIAFSGLGNPHGFEKLLKSMDAHISVSLRFGDHHRYKRKEIEAIERLYGKTNASLIVTTEKDEIRINKKFIQENNFYALKIGMLIKNVKELEDMIKK